MPGLNDSHKTKLVASFQHLDELLGTALDRLDAEDRFLFPRYLPDVSPVQRKLLGDYLVQFRRAMRRFLDARGMAVGRPRIGAAWALHITLTAAQTALDELRPDKLRGYGELDDEGAREVAALLAGLGAILAQMDGCLAPQAGADVGARAAMLGTGTREAALLRRIAEVTGRYGLVEFRPALLWLLERMEEPFLEVAFFGRVSSGKSSLINWLLGADVLPTGVTPVTTVPTRIVAGDAPRATIHCAGKQPLSIEPARLREFVSEQENPDNRKNVVRVVVAFPAQRLGKGVCLVDTPGLGSLATAGAAQTLAYLPRCDVAILLVDAAAGLEAEDVAVARSLQTAGADLLVALSRADLLLPADHGKMLDYLRTKFREQLGTSVPVWPVSVSPRSQALAQRWLDEALAPRQARQRELAEASMRRKIAGLRDAVVAALQQIAAASAPRGQGAEPVADMADEADAARAAIEAARSAVRGWDDHRRERLAAWLDAVSLTAAQEWVNDAVASPDKIAVLLAGEIRAWADGLAVELANVRSRIMQSLTALSDRLPQAGILSELPVPSGQPLFDAAVAVRNVSLQYGIMGVLGNGVRQHLAREQLEQQASAPLERMLSSYERALQSWGLDYLDQLERAFSAAASPVEANLRTDAGMIDANAIAQDIARLKDSDDDGSDTGEEKK